VLIRYVLIATLVLLAGAWPAGLPVSLALLLALVPGLMLVLVHFFGKDSRISGTQMEFMIESSFLLTGVMAAIL
jgi:4-hydroxy-3-methylbut-2-enyl diphosphate reductase